MQNKLDEVSFNQTLLTKCIFKGMTLTDIGKVMNVSTSSVSYYTKQLYAKYNAKTRHDFILRVLGQITDNYKKVILEKNIKITDCENKIDELENLLKNIVQSHENPVASEYWLDEAKKYF